MFLLSKGQNHKLATEAETQRSYNKRATEMYAGCIDNCEVSSFGIFDQLNLDLKFVLVPENMFDPKGLDILAEGRKERTNSSFRFLSFEGVTKESLALKPVKIVLKESQKYLSIGYDWAN